MDEQRRQSVVALRHILPYFSCVDNVTEYHNNDSIIDIFWATP